MSVDSSGRQAVDFVWGKHPMQPNDDRAATITQTGGTTGSDQISYKTYVVTAASASGGVVTYTSANTLQVGELVTITGLSTSAFNLTNVAVASATSSQFTVTNAATGTGVTGATAVAKAVVSVLPGVGADTSWSATTKVASDRLNPELDSHEIVEAGWSGYPAFLSDADVDNLANFIVTAAVGNGTTVTYTAQNYLRPGATVNITGLTASAYNLSNVTVATANAVSFTVTNSASAGTITGQYGKVQSTTALSAADGVGQGNIIVPNVLGETTAVALDLLRDAGYEAARITTASAATNAAGVVTAASRTAGSGVTTITDSSHGFVTGNKVTISGVDASVNGTYVVTRLTDNTFTVTTTATTVLALTSITGSVVAVAGTIKSQSTAANAAGVSTTATITITPWAAAS